MRLVYAAACALAVTSSLGCSMFMRSMEKPTAEVRDVSVTSAGFGGVAGNLQVDVTNPNAFGVPLSGVDWKLSVGGARAATGRTELSQTIPAKGVAPITTTLAIATGDALVLGHALAQGARNYQLDATFTFSTVVGPLSVEVHATGTLGAGAPRLGLR